MQAMTERPKLLGPHFEGDVVTRWPWDDPRGMELTSELRFVDPAGRVWRALPGDHVNGGSIPRVFWRLYTPFVGSYRWATIIHDSACIHKPYNSRLAHAAFYHAIVASGGSPVTAWLMWACVRMWGPRWECSSTGACAGKDVTP